jgi:hypothetical protein
VSSSDMIVASSRQMNFPGRGCRQSSPTCGTWMMTCGTGIGFNLRGGGL